MLNFDFDFDFARWMGSRIILGRWCGRFVPLYVPADSKTHLALYAVAWSGGHD